MSFIIGTAAYELGGVVAIRNFFSNIYNYLAPRVVAYGTERAKAELARYNVERYLSDFNGAK